jgi:tight adherence protein B
MNNGFILFAIGVFLATVLLVYGLSMLWQSYYSRQAKTVTDRLQRLAAGKAVRTGDESIVKATGGESAFVTRLIAFVPRVESIKQKLKHSGLGWSITRLFVYSIGCAAIVGLGMLLFGLAIPFVLLGAGVALTLPSLYVSRRLAIALRLFEHQLPEALDMIARSMRVGFSLGGALKLVSDELPAPLGDEFRATYDEINYGVPLDTALRNMLARTPIDELRYFVVAAVVQRETGGNLTETLWNLSMTIRERIKLRGKIRTMTAEGRLSALILSILPLFVGCAISVTTPTYLRIFWTDPAAIKLATLTIGVVAIGNFWMRQLAKVRF